MLKNKSTTENIIDPFNLRRELSELFKGDNKFRLNSMDDPAELLFAILNAFHSYIFDVKSLRFSIERPCDPQCLSHSYFWINLLEQTVIINLTLVM